MAAYEPQLIVKINVPPLVHAPARASSTSGRSPGVVEIRDLSVNDPAGTGGVQTRRFDVFDRPDRLHQSWGEAGGGPAGRGGHSRGRAGS